MKRILFIVIVLFLTIFTTAVALAQGPETPAVPAWIGAAATRSAEVREEIATLVPPLATTPAVPEQEAAGSPAEGGQAGGNIIERIFGRGQEPAEVEKAAEKASPNFLQRNWKWIILLLLIIVVAVWFFRTFEFFGEEEDDYDGGPSSSRPLARPASPPRRPDGSS